MISPAKQLAGTSINSNKNNTYELNDTYKSLTKQTLCNVKLKPGSGIRAGKQIGPMLQLPGSKEQHATVTELQFQSTERDYDNPQTKLTNVGRESA